MEDFDFFGNNANDDDDYDDYDMDDDDDDDDDDDGGIVHFHYTGAFGAEDVPSNVTHVTVDPSVKVIEDWAFERCRRLTTAELPEGLERIGRCAFQHCKRLCHINIPSTVKVICGYAFNYCRNLESVELPDGLEKLDYAAFAECTSLQSIYIPPRVKTIADCAFGGCDALQNVDLPEGLECIEEYAFSKCPMLRHIKIPSTVKEISPYAFSETYYDDGDVDDDETNLEWVQFCDDIEEFVSGESLRDWWNNGVSEGETYRTYNFLVQCNVPTRLLLLIETQWQANIHDMLRIIPSISFDDIDDHFNAIDSKLTAYEIAQGMSLLELAIWKSKICEQYGSNMGNLSSEMKLLCLYNCGACDIIRSAISIV